MTVTHYRSGGTWYKEIIDRSYKAMDALKVMYQNEGHRTTMSRFEGRWILTIEEHD